jgi:hypothetical protein
MQIFSGLLPKSFKSFSCTKNITSIKIQLFVDILNKGRMNRRRIKMLDPFFLEKK